MISGMNVVRWVGLMGLLISASPTWAELDRFVQVSGEAKVEAEPDQIDWRIQVAAKDWDADDCKREVTKEVSKVRKALTDIYGSQQEINNSPFRSYRSKNDNHCSVEISLKTQQMEQYERTLDAVTALGDFDISAIPTVADQETPKNEALRKAVAAARAKAALIAEAIEVPLGEVISVTESGGVQVPQQMRVFKREMRMSTSSLMDEEGSSPEFGKLIIHSNVMMTIALSDR